LFITGLFLGIPIGIISGIVFLILFKTLISNSIRGISSILKVIAQILAIPTFCYGGQWIAGKLLDILFENPDVDKMVSSYIISVGLFFSLIVIFPISRWIIKLGEDLGKGTE